MRARHRGPCRVTSPIQWALDGALFTTVTDDLTVSPKLIDWNLWISPDPVECLHGQEHHTLVAHNEFWLFGHGKGVSEYEFYSLKRESFVSFDSAKEKKGKLQCKPWKRRLLQGLQRASENFDTKMISGEQFDRMLTHPWIDYHSSYLAIMDDNKLYVVEEDARHMEVMWSGIVKKKHFECKQFIIDYQSLLWVVLAQSVKTGSFVTCVGESKNPCWIVADCLIGQDTFCGNLTVMPSW